VRIEKGVKDDVLLVAVSDFRKNYNATAIYFASDREKFAARLQRSEQDKKLEEWLKLLLAELAKLEADLEADLSEEPLCEEDWPVGQRIKCPRCGREGKAGISFFKAKGREYVYLVVNHSDGRKCVIARADGNTEGVEKPADLAASSEEVVPARG
jgi:formate dehydrogenase maturation protein FdhE